MAYIREYSPGGGRRGFPSIQSSYAYIWWLGPLRVVQALKVIILPLPLGAGVMCCPPLIFKPSLGRREKLAEKSREEGDLPSCTSPVSMYINGLAFNLHELKLIFWFQMESETF